MRRDEHDTTGQDATGHDDTDAVVLTVADAAQLLGISPGAVRKRIERGQLAGRKVSGQWRVTVGATDATEYDATDATRPDTTQRNATAGLPPPVAVSDAARAQLAAIRDEWVAPLVDRIGALERENGRLEAERDQAARERDDLRAEIERVRTVPPVSEAPTAPPAAPGGADASKPGHGSRWRRWLRRLVDGP